MKSKSPLHKTRLKIGLNIRNIIDKNIDIKHLELEISLAMLN